MRNKLIYLSKTNNYFEIKNKLLADPKLLSIGQKESDHYFQNLTCRVVTILDENYPKPLRLIKSAPYVIYYFGNLQIINNNPLAIIGSGQLNSTMIQKIKNLVTDNEQAIIAGDSRGFEQAIVLLAMRHNSKAVCVTASGFEHLKFKRSFYHELKKNHLLISECPPNQKINNVSAKARNRIIVALSSSVFIIDGANEKFIYTIVDHAHDFSKEVSILKYARIKKQKTNLSNNLIEEGAKISKI